MKKIVSAFLSLMMLFALTIPALATEGGSAATADSNTVNADSQPRAIPRGIRSFDLQDVGDTHILMEDESGVLSIELTDESETVSNITRAGTTKETSKSYTVYYTTLLGGKKAAVEITATATWISNGANSYIQNLHGEYSVKNSDYSCAWDDSYKTASDYLHYLVLDIRHGSTTCSYSLSATMAFTDAACTIPKVTVDIGEVWCG